jgi:hypothetical protein
MDGFQLVVPNSSAQMTFSILEAQDVPHSFELQPVWVHVDGVPHTVRHFLGLWAVGSLIGTTLDVDLVSLRSLGVVRILVAMMEPKNLDKFHEVHGCACLGVTVTVKLKGYDLYFRREQPDFVADPGFTPFFWRKIWMLLTKIPIRLLAWILITRSLLIALLMGRQFWMGLHVPRAVMCSVLLLLHL